MSCCVICFLLCITARKLQIDDGKKKKGLDYFEKLVKDYFEK